MATDRDRDSAGRARQGRPRDALGRPLPYGSQGVEPVPEEPLPPQQALELAHRLLKEGRSFSAHEVLEACWKVAPTEERDLWQGLAQLCVALTHAERGNVVGARRLLARGSRRLSRYQSAGQEPYGLRLAALTQCADRRISALAASGR